MDILFIGSIIVNFIMDHCSISIDADIDIIEKLTLLQIKYLYSSIFIANLSFIRNSILFYDKYLYDSTGSLIIKDIVLWIWIFEVSVSSNFVTIHVRFYWFLNVTCIEFFKNLVLAHFHSGEHMQLWKQIWWRFLVLDVNKLIDGTVSVFGL